MLDVQVLVLKVLVIGLQLIVLEVLVVVLMHRILFL